MGGYFRAGTQRRPPSATNEKVAVAGMIALILGQNVAPAWGAMHRGRDAHIAVRSGGVMELSGVAYGDKSIESGGEVRVFSGARDNSAVVFSDGSQVINRRGRAITVSSGNALVVSSNDTASSTTINSGGVMSVTSGGSAINTVINSGGYLSVNTGGSAANINQM